LRASEKAISVTLADVEGAREIVGPVLHRTPLFSSRSLSERIGAPAYLKAEKPVGDVLQGMRTFGVVKTRGRGKATEYVVG